MHEQVIEIGLYTLSFIFIAIGFVGCILPYPGHLSILLALAIVPTEGLSYPWYLWVLLILLCIIGGLVDNITTSMGCKKYGGSKAAIGGSIIGLVIGAFFPPVGIILGPFLGAFGAEYFIAKRSMKAGAQVGLGATLGMVAGMLAKLLIAALMLLLVLLWFYGVQ